MQHAPSFVGESMSPSSVPQYHFSADGTLMTIILNRSIGYSG